MKLFRQALALAGAAVLAMTCLVLLPASPAQASAQQCKAGRFCVWTTPEYRGGFLSVGSGHDQPDLTRFPARADLCQSSHNWNDCISSIWNNTSKPYCVYVDINFNTLAIVIPPDRSEHALYNNVWYDAQGQLHRWEDSISSFRPARPGNKCFES